MKEVVNDWCDSLHYLISFSVQMYIKRLKANLNNKLLYFDMF